VHELPFSNVVPQKQKYVYLQKNMNTLDYIILFPVLIGFIIGLFKGLIKEVVGLAIVILGIYLARLFAPLASDLLVQWLDISPKGAQPLGFLLIFSLVAIVLTLTGRMIQGLVQALSLGFINSMIGGVFGALKIALLYSILFNVLQSLEHRFSIIEPESRANSLLYEPILELAPELWEELTEQEELTNQP